MHRIEPGVPPERLMEGGKLLQFQVQIPVILFKYAG